MGATRLEAAEKTDAGRVAPIRACVSYQIDRLKSGFEALGRTVMPGNCALMGATRLASGIFQQPRDASPPLVLAFLQCVSGNFPQNVLSKKSILNTLPERAKALNTRFGVLPYINILNRLRANLL